MSIGQSQCDCYQWESGKNTAVEDVMMTRFTFILSMRKW
jgi:hypothetical protein